MSVWYLILLHAKAFSISSFWHDILGILCQKMKLADNLYNIFLYYGKVYFCICTTHHRLNETWGTCCYGNLPKKFLFACSVAPFVEEITFYLQSTSIKRSQMTLYFAHCFLLFSNSRFFYSLCKGLEPNRNWKNQNDNN